MYCTVRGSMAIHFILKRRWMMGVDGSKRFICSLAARLILLLLRYRAF
jgi:hypothetical protein